MRTEGRTKNKKGGWKLAQIVNCEKGKEIWDFNWKNNDQAQKVIYIRMY